MDQQQLNEIKALRANSFHSFKEAVMVKIKVLGEGDPATLAQSLRELAQQLDLTSPKLFNKGMNWEHGTLITEIRKKK